MTRYDWQAVVYVAIVPAVLLVLAAISMWNGHGDLW